MDRNLTLCNEDPQASRGAVTHTHVSLSSLRPQLRGGSVEPDTVEPTPVGGGRDSGKTNQQEKIRLCENGKEVKKKRVAFIRSYRMTKNYIYIYI